MHDYTIWKSAETAIFESLHFVFRIQLFWYPTYCHGARYILSNDVALNLYDVTKYVPFLWIDDVYIGFCMSLLGLQITDSFFGFFIDAYDHPLNFLEWCLNIQKYVRNERIMGENCSRNEWWNYNLSQQYESTCHSHYMHRFL